MRVDNCLLAALFPTVFGFLLLDCFGSHQPTAVFTNEFQFSCHKIIPALVWTVPVTVVSWRGLLVWHRLWRLVTDLLTTLLRNNWAQNQFFHKKSRNRNCVSPIARLCFKLRRCSLLCIIYTIYVLLENSSSRDFWAGPWGTFFNFF